MFWGKRTHSRVTKNHLVNPVLKTLSCVPPRWGGTPPGTWFIGLLLAEVGFHACLCPEHVHFRDRMPVRLSVPVPNPTVDGKNYPSKRP